MWEHTLLRMHSAAPVSLKLLFDKRIPSAASQEREDLPSPDNSVKTRLGLIIGSRTNFYWTQPAYAIAALTFKPSVPTKRNPERSLVVTTPSPESPQGSVEYKSYVAGASALVLGPEDEGFEEKAYVLLSDIEAASKFIIE